MTLRPLSASSPPPTCATPPTSSARSLRLPTSSTAASPSSRPASGPRHREHRQAAVELWEKVNRPNAMIKNSGNPRRPAGHHRHPGQGYLRQRHPDLLARALRAGHRRFIEGIAQADANGHDLKHIGSVASFFVSRVDTLSTSCWKPTAPTRPRLWRARPLWPTLAWLTNSSRRSSPRIRVGRPGCQGRQGSASAVGFHRHQERRLLRLQVR